MVDVILSDGEKRYIAHSVEDDCRVDGRRCNEARRLQLETNVTPNCHGSSHVRIGNTDLLIGVKVQVEDVDPELPNEGRYEFSADCSANASPVFEGRGGEEIVGELVTVLDSAFIPCLDLKILSLIPGKSCWVVYVDILILEFGSKPNLFDASAIGVIAALHDTKIPNVTFDQEIDDLDVPEDPSQVVALDTSRLPVLVSLTKVGPNYVVDATENEEAASVSSVVLAVNSAGEIIHFKKISSGTLFMPPLTSVLKMAKERGMMLHQDLLRALKQEATFKSQVDKSLHHLV